MAFADKPRYRRASFYEDGTNLLISLSISDIFTPKSFAALTSGIVTKVRVRILISEQDSAKYVSLSKIEKHIVYDLWNERYELRSSTLNGIKRKRADTHVAAFRQISELKNVPVANLANLKRGTGYTVSVFVELNPVSAGDIAKIRQWIKRPANGSKGQSAFGTFVASFVAKEIPQAENVLRIVTQPFYIPRE